MIKGCLIGQNIEYSFSKMIHESLGTTYDLISIKQKDIKEFLENNDYDFINVTIPYKEEVIKYLDVVKDEVKEIGACNLIKKENGKLVGYNTDYSGFLKALDYHNIDYHNKKVLILGTGGASSAIEYAFRINNSICQKVSRSKEGYLHYNNLDTSKYDIIVNATPVGTYPLILDKLNIVGSKNQVVIDLVYNPRRTMFLQESKSEIKINGISMLVFQALEVYDNLTPNTGKVLIDLLNKYSNIVIIGLPYAGKSYLGKVLLDRYPERDLYDIDDIIEKRYGLIKDIFKKYGEEYFRNIEHEIIKEVALKNNAIIIPGAGFFKNQENINLLKCNYLLEHNDSRPLINSEKDLEKLYQERHKIYEELKDDVIKGDFHDYYSD